MEKAIAKYYQYCQSESREVQGNRNSIQKYLDEGFYIKESRNGYWVLVKPAKVFITLKGNETGVTGTFNMKEEILAYLGKCKISPKSAEAFWQACKNRQITFEIDEKGQKYTIWYN